MDMLASYFYTVALWKKTDRGRKIIKKYWTVVQIYYIRGRVKKKKRSWEGKRRIRVKDRNKWEW